MWEDIQLAIAIISDSHDGPILFKPDRMIRACCNGLYIRP